MAGKQVKLFPKRREVDAERLAAALLELVSQLSAEDQLRYFAEGQRLLAEMAGGDEPKGSAA